MRGNGAHVIPAYVYYLLATSTPVCLMGDCVGRYQVSTVQTRNGFPALQLREQSRMKL